MSETEKLLRLTPNRVKWLKAAGLAMETCFLPRALPAPNMACGIGASVLASPFC